MASEPDTREGRRHAALANPLLHQDALTERERAHGFKWHLHAGSERSSQAFAISAFGTVRSFEARNAIVEAFLREVFPSFPRRPRPGTWEITPEAEAADLLSEFGASQPTSIDIFLESRCEVIALESKFITDARHGFGGCSQTRKSCGGFHGPGSDLAKGTSAWCRLENWEGTRSPRTYWALGRAYFRPEVFRQQGEGEHCPLSGPNYQLMRNFLFAAAAAEKTGRAYFAVVAIAPRAFANRLSEQVERFKEEILLEKYRDRIAFVSYELYAGTLADQGGARGRELSRFLLEKMAATVG